VAWRDLLYVTLAGRLDGNSAFGRNNSTAFYPSGSISYVLSDESFWPKNDVVSSLRLRLAGGQSGREPTFRLADGSFTSSAYLLNGAATQTGLVPNTLGNANLKPERSTEYEVGFDAGFEHERFTLALTAYDRSEQDLIFAVPLDISTGTIGIAPPAENENLGKIDNRGLEAAVNGNIFTTRIISLDLGITAAIERSKLVNQGSLPPTPISNGISGATIQYDEFGEPIGEYYAIPYTYKDLNGDGIIEPNEITYGTKAVPVGEPGPRDEFSFSPTLRIFKYFRLNALLDRRDGATVYDGGDAFRCGAFFVGQECNDPHASLKDQAAAVALNSAGPGTEYGYILNGSFWRLREVSLTIMAPDSWTRHYLGGHDVSLTFSGRNLATWTPYRGLDPEVSYSTFSNVSAPLPYITQQFYDQPLLREWIGRFNISW
jgi:outer membrane receptor protein involved in Fe transport